MKNRILYYLYLIPLILFFFLSGSEYVQKSMYNDGIWYAILSKNLTNGEGSIWYPKLTETIFSVFHEHPPLVFGIQSLFFSIFGNHIFTERFYAFTIFLFSALLIVSIWKLIFRNAPLDRKLWFIPLSLWLLNEVVYHYYPSNMLEATLGVFTLASVYFLLKSIEGKLSSINVILIILASLSLFFATLCKGVVGLFPLALPFLYWIIFRSFSFPQLILRSSILISVLALCYTMLLSFEVPFDSLSKYYDSQFLASLTEQRTTYHHRENRLYIVRRLFEVLIPTLTVTAAIILSKKAKWRHYISDKNRQLSILFVLIGLSASLPIVLSPKQAIYYLLPSIPYFAIGFGVLLSTTINRWISKEWIRLQYRIFVSIISVLLLASVSLTLLNIGRVSTRDQKVLHDVYEIGKVIPQNSVIGSKAYSAHLVGYLYRLFEISIDTSSSNTKMPYLIVGKGESSFTNNQDYSKVILNTLQYDLYQRIQ